MVSMRKKLSIVSTSRVNISRASSRTQSVRDYCCLASTMIHLRNKTVMHSHLQPCLFNPQHCLVAGAMGFRRPQRTYPMANSHGGAPTLIKLLLLLQVSMFEKTDTKKKSEFGIWGISYFSFDIKSTPNRNKCA